MQGFRNLRFTLFALITLVWISNLTSLQAQTTSFTYQGRLSDGGVPANGVYDLQFKLFDAASGGAQQGGTVLRDDVSVTGGTFSVILDFGALVFSGANRWLEVSVRPGASTDAYTTLSPLQPITSTPYAVKSLSAATADGLSASALGAANTFVAPQSISSTTGNPLPDGDGAVAVVSSAFTGTTGIGVGVAGFVTDPNVEGAGVAGIVQSPNAVGGYFRNDAAPGPILIASTGNQDHTVLIAVGNGNNGRVGINTEDSLNPLTVRGTPTVPLSGTVTVTASSNMVAGTGTHFGSEVVIGDRITNPANGETKVVQSIFSDTSLMTISNWFTGASGTFNNTPAIFRIDDAINNTRLMLDGTGALGIGIFAPIAALDVGGRSLFRSRVSVSNNASNQKPSLLTVRAAAFSSLTGTAAVTSGSTTVTTSGNNFLNNIGLGDRVTVNGETHTVVAIANNGSLTVDAPFANTATGPLTPIAGLFRADKLNPTPPNDAIPVFLINDSGNVGIGEGAALNPTDRLQVFGDMRVGTSGTNGCVKAFDGSVIGGTCSSDERLKANIEPFAPLMSKLMQLRPVSYNWKANENPEYHFGNERTSGLVAQEVEKVFPEMVATDDHGYKAVNYSRLPLMLLEAVKELKAESDQREAELMNTVKQQQAQIQELLAVVKRLAPTN